jgi:5-formaminoimidazole-4-carboxamide-1-beta-D-ribofuranosyl 5'-monophosphate synthetase
MKDILIKQEKNNTVVVKFQTEKAKKAFYNSASKKTVKEKLTILSDSIANMVAWAISHDLTVDSQVKIIIKAKG